MDQNPGNNGINLDDILLPKKEERTPASASRENAGVLLENEQKAELPKAPPPAPPPPKPKPEGPLDETSIAPLETYQKDVETVIAEKNISAVSIAAAEAQRAGRTAQLASTVEAAAKGLNPKMIAGVAAVTLGVALVVVALGVLTYVLTRPGITPAAQQGSSAPFMSVDDTQALVLTPEQLNRDTLMQNLESLKEKTALSLGLVSRMYLVVSTTSVDQKNIPPPITSQQLLSTLAPNVADDLLRTFDPNYYLLGVHVFDGNQEFLILKVDSYVQAYAGMLQWERTMATELSPLFIRTPRPRTAEELSAASTTAQTPSLLPTQFVDTVVANHNARAVLNDAGDTLLLWSFIDRDTLVITNNESTLAEIISRRSVYTPAQ